MNELTKAHIKRLEKALEDTRLQIVGWEISAEYLEGNLADAKAELAEMTRDRDSWKRRVQYLEAKRVEGLA